MLDRGGRARVFAADVQVQIVVWRLFLAHLVLFTPTILMRYSFEERHAGDRLDASFSFGRQTLARFCIGQWGDLLAGSGLT